MFASLVIPQPSSVTIRVPAAVHHRTYDGWWFDNQCSPTLSLLCHLFLRGQGRNAADAVVIYDADDVLGAADFYPSDIESRVNIATLF